MEQTVELFLRQVWAGLEDIYGREKRRIDKISAWSPLQAGIFNYVKITRSLPERGLSPRQLAIDVYEPLSWSDSAYRFELDFDPEQNPEAWTDDKLRGEFWPALQQKIVELRKSGQMGPRFFDYRLDLELEFHRADRKQPLKLSAALIDADKREQLRQTLDAFIARKVLAPGPARPKQEDLFFFAELLFNPDFLPAGRDAPDAGAIEPLLSAVAGKLRDQPQRLAQWRGEYRRALRNWAERLFLPHYFEPAGDYSLSFTPKPETERPQADADSLDFFVYAALKIGESEPDLRLQYLGYADLLGSDTARRYLTAGSGIVDSRRRGSLFVGQANDVLQSIELKLLAEEEPAYREALDDLCALLEQGFPNTYALKLKSGEKRWLPLKTLAKSPLHRFFANALHYPALFPAIARYAELAMEEYAWYNDVEPGEKSVMPGTYAVFGLGLRSEAYFPLLLRYMALVDTEHQSAQDEYAAAFVAAHGLSGRTLPVLVAILLASGQSAKPIKPCPIDTPELARLLLTSLEMLPEHERDTVRYRLFGDADKLARTAKKAEPELRAALEQIRAAAP